jgi:ribosomal protein S18 acetylase RimI-like enzyme
MGEPIYRAGTREEVRAFSVRWEAHSMNNYAWPSDLCIDESYWRCSDHFLVAEVGGEVVGVATFREGKPSYFDLVAVAPAFRRQGIGDNLTNQVLVLLR